jgi:hypothetical protein
MRTPILNLFNEARLTTNDLKKRDVYKARVTQHKTDLKSAGWKKSHRIVSTGSNHDTTVFTHPEHTGHEIHLHPQTGSFEHKVNFGAEHKQKGKAAEGMSELAKHLDAHSRHTQYDAHSASSKREKNSWHTDHGHSAPNPRGPQG